MRNLSNPNPESNSNIPNRIVTENQGANAPMTTVPSTPTDKNDQTKEEVQEAKDIKTGTASSEVNVLATDRPVSGTVTEAKQISQVPIPEVSSDKISPERKEQIVAAKVEEDHKREGLEAITTDGHKTTISPLKTGNYNFIVNCECQWQGRFVTIREANEGAMNHKKERARLANKNK